MLGRDGVAGERVRARWHGIEVRGQLLGRLDASRIRQEPSDLRNLAGILGGEAGITLPGRCEVTSAQTGGALLAGDGLATGYLCETGSNCVTYQLHSRCGCVSYQRFGENGQEVATGNGFEVFLVWQDGPGRLGPA